MRAGEQLVLPAHPIPPPPRPSRRYKVTWEGLPHVPAFYVAPTAAKAKYRAALVIREFYGGSIFGILQRMSATLASL